MTDTLHEQPTEGPVLTEVRQNLVTPATAVVGRVVSSEICTNGRKAAGFVRHVAIDVSGTPLAGSFRAGQSFGVLPPGVDEKGNAHKLRLYSISSPSAGEDGQGNVLATTVKRLIDEHTETHRLFVGVASNYLCDLQIGDEVRVTGPSGKRFLLPADVHAHHYVFFATGTGIAPFRAMLGDLQTAGYRGRVALVMGSPYTSDLLYHKQLTDLASRWPSFRYITAISRERQDDSPKKMYVQDRIDNDPRAGEADGLPALFASPRTLVYVCGIAGMELGIFQKMATSLAPDVRAGYLGIEADAGEPDTWTRRMIHRQVKPTRRVFLEVY